MTETKQIPSSGIPRHSITVEGKIHNFYAETFKVAMRKLNSLLPRQMDKMGGLFVCEDGTVAWLPNCMISEKFINDFDLMRIEHNTLERRRNELQQYFRSEQFNDLDNFDQYLLLNQYMAMGNYLSVLRIRIERAENNNPDLI